jgi:hypothetical protein
MTRMAGPPMETWTISRKVVSALPIFASGLGWATGAAAQVPTQWSGEAAEAAVGPRQTRLNSRRASGGSVLLLSFMVVLEGIELTLHLIAVSCRQEGCSIVAKVADWRATVS